MNILYRADMLKKIAALILLCAAGFSAAGEVSAQTGGGVKLEAQAGLDGACKSGAWLPVRVTVENTGAGFDARVQASYKNDQGGQSTQALEISLPATSRKEIFLYVRLTGGVGNFNVSVLEGGTERAKKNLNVSCGGAEDLYFGVLADNPAPYDGLRNMRALSGGKTRVAQLTVADLPDRAQGWSALDALIISNVDTGAFSADQKQALQLWIANGGRLFVTGGIHWQTTTAGLQDILPVSISSTKNVTSLSALSAYVKDSALLDGGAILADGKILDDAHVLVAQDNIPLLVEKRVGYGKVFYFAADPGLQPLNSWREMEVIYDHLLAFKPQKPAWADAAWDMSAANSALSALSELDLPSFLYVCCWLGIYILVIGPINYLVLRRVKRAELAWVTVPVLVILFSCLAYVFGFAYRGVSPILNRLALAQGWDGVPQMRVNDLVGAYSPSRAAYTVQTQQQFMLYEPFGVNAGLQGGADLLQFKNDAGTSIPDVRVEIGGMASVGAEGYQPALKFQHDLTLTLNSTVPQLSGTITNVSGHALRDAALITPNEWYELGDLAPNQPKKISRRMPAVMLMTDSYSFLSGLGYSPYSNSSGDEDARRVAFLRANIDDSIRSVPGIYLMGWIDDIPAPVNLQEQKSDAVDTLLFFQKITPAVVTAPEFFTINASQYDWASSVGTLGAFQIPSDGYEIRFQPAEAIPFGRVVSLSLNIDQNAVPNTLRVLLWNFEAKTWGNIPPPWTGFSLVSNPSQYIGMDGEIRMRFEPDQNTYMQIDSINFDLKVAP